MRARPIRSQVVGVSELKTGKVVVIGSNDLNAHR